MSIDFTPTRSWLIRAARLAIVGLVLWLLVSFGVAYHLTRRPHAVFAEPVPKVSWGKFEPLRLHARDGEELGAWLVQGKEGPSVVLLHGNGGSRRSCLDRAEILAREGCCVLLVSLRAHGDSTGDHNDIGYSARHDVIAAIEFLERRRPGKPVILHGTSLGAGAAAFASEELGHRVSGYILESPYRDLRTAVRNRTRNALPPVLDWIAYQGLVVVAPTVLPDLDKIAPVHAIKGVPTDVPVLILAGENDRKALVEEARAIYEAVRSHAMLEIFPDAAHLRMHVSDPTRYRNLIRTMIHKGSEFP